MGKGVLTVQDEGGEEEEQVDEGEGDEGGGEDEEEEQKNPRQGEILPLPRISRLQQHVQKNPFRGGIPPSHWRILRARVQMIPKLSHHQS